jgi:hypothetical protein
VSDTNTFVLFIYSWFFNGDGSELVGSSKQPVQLRGESSGTASSPTQTGVRHPATHRSVIPEVTSSPYVEIKCWMRVRARIVNLCIKLHFFYLLLLFSFVPTSFSHLLCWFHIVLNHLLVYPPRIKSTLEDLLVSVFIGHHLNLTEHFITQTCGSLLWVVLRLEDGLSKGLRNISNIANIYLCTRCHRSERGPHIYKTLSLIRQQKSFVSSLECYYLSSQLVTKSHAVFTFRL